MECLFDNYDYLTIHDDSDFDSLLPIDTFYVEKEYTIGMDGDDFITSNIFGILSKDGNYLSRYILNVYSIPDMKKYFFITCDLKELMNIVYSIREQYSLTEPKF